MRKGEVKYRGEIMRQLSVKRWSHPRPLSFKEINAVLDEAKKEFPIELKTDGSTDAAVILAKYQINVLNWFEKWLGDYDI